MRRHIEVGFGVCCVTRHGALHRNVGSMGRDAVRDAARLSGRVGPSISGLKQQQSTRAAHHWDTWRPEPTADVWLHGAAQRNWKGKGTRQPQRACRDRHQTRA